MKSFKDKEGREWLIEFDLDSTERVRAIANVDLLNVGETGGELTTLMSDLRKAGTVLYAFCLPQCDTRGVSMEQFYRSLTGDSIAAGVEAVWGAAEDFFPIAERMLICACLGKARLLRDESLRRAEEMTKDPRLDQAMLARLNREVERVRERFMQEMQSDVSSTSLPASPDSALERILSEG